jgi:hypothetical protein
VAASEAEPAMNRRRVSVVLGLGMAFTRTAI